MPRQPRIPSYRLHKASGQAVVTLSGRDHYLGQHGSPESREAYNRLIAEWLSAGRQSPAQPSPDATVSEVLSAYFAYARTYYVTPEGRPTSQLDRVLRSLAAARKLYGSTPARLFGAAALRACRDAMVAEGWCRRVVNQRVGCLKRAWKWAAAEELIPASLWHSLSAVEGLRAGRTSARESEPVEPAPEAAIAAVLPRLLPALRDVANLQLLTAMRPGEVLALRPCELDRSGDVWVYRPSAHKTRHRGHERTILFGPKAQAILAPYLLRDESQYCFSPREAVERRYRELGRKIRFGKGRVPGTRYQVTSYAHAVQKACDKLKVGRWHPHQLRHNAATRLVEQFGWETARIILGHRHINTTRIYAADDLARAMDAIRRVG